MGLFSRLFGGKRSAPAATSQAMVSLVVLLREPFQWDRLALQASLDAVFPGHFIPQNENSFVVGDQPAQLMVKSLVPLHAGLFLVIFFPEPYQNVSSFGLKDRDPRLDELVRRHNAWMSIDLIAPIGTREDAYRFIGKALARLAPDDALVLVHPATNAMVPFDAETRPKLQAAAVLRALGMEA